MQINVNIEEATKEVDELLLKLNEISKLKNEMLVFITAEELAERMGCCQTTANRIFNRPDFPTITFGKPRVALLSAVIEYFSIRRGKED